MTSNGQLSIYRPLRADPESYFSREEVKKSRAYNKPLGRIRILSLLVNLAWLAAFIGLEGAPRLVDELGIGAWPLQVIALVSTVVVLAALFNAPISLYTNFVHEEQWGFNTQTPKLWITDQIKGLLLGLVLANALLLALWTIVQVTDLWWLYGALVLTAFAVVLGALAPIVIIPIFNKLTPIEDEELASRLRDLARRGGVSVSEVQVMDASKRTRHDNAFFTGMGRTRRLVVFDNMVEWERPVIDVVVAHEVGHWRHRHLMKSILVGTLTSFAVFVALRYLMTWEVALDFAGVAGVRDPASIPLFLLGFSVLGTVTGLIDSWFSRAHERQADLFALNLTKDTTSFRKVWKEFTTRDLADLTPSWWKRINGSHPPIADRVAFGEVWAERNQPSGEVGASRVDDLGVGQDVD